MVDGNVIGQMKFRLRARAICIAFGSRLTG
jgi:hypothetical protein